MLCTDRRKQNYSQKFLSRERRQPQPRTVVQFSSFPFCFLSPPHPVPPASPSEFYLSALHSPLAVLTPAGSFSFSSSLTPTFFCSVAPHHRPESSLTSHCSPSPQRSISLSPTHSLPLVLSYTVCICTLSPFSRFANHTHLGICFVHKPASARRQHL